MKYNQQKNIFFYDGECGFCDATVLYLMDRTPSKELHFSALQNPFSKGILVKHGIVEFDSSTSFFYDGKKVYRESGAIARALMLCSGPSKIMGIVLLAFPKFLRNWGYRLFSKRRMTIGKLLGGKHCRLLSPEEQLRFIQ